MSTARELRVLAGVHRDARCPVHNGASIGSDINCDIVLSDEGVAPLAGQIRLDPQGWSVVPDGDTSPTPTLHDWNAALCIGAAWITIASEDAPWIVPDVASSTGPESDHVVLDRPLFSNGQGPQSETPSAHNGSDGTDALAAKKPPFLTWSTWLIIGAVGLLMMSAIALYTVSTGFFSSRNRTEAANAAQSLGQISAAIERLGLTASLHAAMSKSGNVTVSGWVRDQSQYNAVAAAMSQIWPMPGLSISLESAAINTARDTLQRFSVKYDPLYQGNGHMTIAGVASSATERASALDAVRAQLPGLTVTGNAIALAQQVSDTLTRKLAAQGLSGIKLIWQSGHLEIHPPTLDAGQQAKLESVIDDFNKRYWNLAQIGDVPEATVANTVPFTIRSVVGGPQPFIVLSDGTRLLVGGTYKKYRLAAVEDDRIVFDGPRKAVITR